MKNPPVPEQIKLWFLGTFAIIVSALKIPFRNPNFITFTLITSIPLFFITLIPRLPYILNQLINLFIDALIQLNILTVTYQTINTKHLINVSWASEPITQFLKAYLVDLVNFFTALTTVYASSTIHTSNGDHKASMGLRDLLKNSVTKTRWRNAVLTFIAMSIVRNILLPVVLYWINAQSLLSSWCGNSFILKALHFIVLAVAFAKWVEYNACWASEPITQFLKAYLVDLLNFFTALTTIYASSTIHTSNGDHKASMGLRVLLKNSVTKTRWRDAVLTFIAMSIVCNIFLPDVLYWINAQSLHSSWCGNSIILKALRFIVLAVAFAKWVEYNAWWNLSVVVSILEIEEQRGFRAFSTSSQLMKGNKQRGYVLMLLLCSVRSSELGYAISCCDLTGLSFRNEDTAYEYFIASLLCLRKVMTWMVYTVYYFDCKNREQRRKLMWKSEM